MGVEGWLSPRELEITESGQVPPDSPGVAGNYFNSDGEVGIVYLYSGNSWNVERFVKPAILGTPERPFQVEASSPDGKLRAVFKYPSEIGNYSSMTLQDNTGHILYENNQIFMDCAKTATWSRDNGSVIVTSERMAWYFSLKDHRLREAP